MTVDIEKTASIITTLRRMSSKELATTIFLIIATVTSAFWIENRYAKLVDTQQRIEQQQTEIIQLQNQILTVVAALPADVRHEIIERSTVNQAINRNKSTYIPQQQN